MKILAIMGSPRRNGTGTKVVREIERRLKEKGDVEVEVLHLVSPLWPEVWEYRPWWSLQRLFGTGFPK
jgi:NAD(P)H-dependent FMN reductase